MGSSAKGGDIGNYIFQYHEKLSADNYSELDALVFAELSYMKFENCELYHDGMTIGEYAEALLQVEDNEDKRAFLDQVQRSGRYEDCVITDSAYENETSQWAALTIQIESDNPDTAVVAMRGTDGTTLGWTEDLELFFDSDGTVAQELSKEYLSHVDEESIYLTGHSKGGNDVIASYIMNEQDVRDRVQMIHNFDGPGVNQDFRGRFIEGYSELDDKLHNIYPYNSIIGKLLSDNPGITTFINCDTRGHMEIPVLGTHDPFSFQLNSDGTFEEAEQNLLSKYLNVVVDDVMNSLSNEERKNVVEVLCKLGIPALIAKAKDNPYSTDDNFIKKVKRAVEIYSNCSDEEKEAVQSMMMQIFISTKDYVYEKIQTAKEELITTLKEFEIKIIKKQEEIASKIKGFVNDVTKKADIFFDNISNYIKDSIFKQHGMDYIVGYGSTNFTVNIRELKCSEGELENVERILKEYQRQIMNLQRELGSSYCRLNFSEIYNSMDSLISYSRQCKEVLNDITEQYQKTEYKILEGR